MPDFDALAEFILQQDARGLSVYHACASFKSPGIWDAELQKWRKRVGENVNALRAFFLDLDAGPGKPYPDQNSALLAVLTFTSAAGLPQPVIVNSGRGLHIYWPLEADLGPKEWRAYASGLRELCRIHGLHIDPVRTADTSSILRTPGTFNRKGGAILPVISSPLIGPYPLSAFVALKEHANAATRTTGRSQPTATPAPAYLVRSAPAGVLAGLASAGEYPAASSKEIAERCEQVRRFRDWRSYGPLPEVIWFDVLGVLAFAADGDAAAHAWAAEHAQYSRQETDGRLDRKRALSGATTCAQFHVNAPAVCERCPFWGKIRSPIILGYPQDARKDRRVSAVPDAHGIGTGVGSDLPKLPAPFAWSGPRLVMQTEHGADGQPVETVISDFPIYLESIANEERGNDHSYVFNIYRPQEGWEQLTIRAAELIGSQGEGIMHAKGAVIHQFGLFVKFAKVSAVDFIRSHASNTCYTQYGWKDDNEAFLYGNKLYRAGSEAYVAGSKELEMRNQWIGPGCTNGHNPAFGLARWKQAASALFALGCEGQAVALLAGFGSVLMKFLCSDEGGATLSLVTPQSARGKSVALAGAYSVWGGKHGLSLTNDDNRIAKFLTLGASGNLPIVWDEIDTRDPLVLRNYIMAFSNGRDKQRANRDGKTVQHANTWQLICITASNSSLVDTLQATDPSNAPSLRVLELAFDLPETINKRGDELREELIANAGYAGEEFIRYLVRPDVRKELVNVLQATQQIMWQRTRLSIEHRFWIRTMTCIAVAAGIVHTLQLLDFDPDRIVDWLIDEVKDIVDGPKEDKLSEITEVDQLAEFIHAQLQYLLLMPHQWTLNMSQIFPTAVPKEINGTFYKKEQVLWIRKQSMAEYAMLNGIPYRQWVKQLKKKGLITATTRKTLTAGTGMPGPQVCVHEIDMQHWTLRGVEQTMEANVVQFPPPRDHP